MPDNAGPSNCSGGNGGPPFAPFQGPLRWPDVEAIARSGAVERFSRMPDVATDYARATARIRAEYASVADYLRATVFAFPAAPEAGGANGTRLVAAPTGTPALVPNDFPYAFEPDENILHYVLWFLEDQTLTLQQARDLACAAFPGHDVI
ncbi:hypothetical protein HK405_008437, partial [Cladochytrium tenue]